MLALLTLNLVRPELYHVRYDLNIPWGIQIDGEREEY